MIADRILVGTRYGCCTVASGREGRGSYFVEVVCDCGKRTKKNIYKLASHPPKRCSRICELRFKYSVPTHSKIFSAWKGMMDRCFNPKNKAYGRYGERGITVCSEWKCDFEAFRRDMGDPHSDALSLDRINNDGIYEPKNCRWATTKEQNRNQSRKALFNYGGESKPVWQWAEETNQPASTIYARLRKGWSGAEVLFGREVNANAARHAAHKLATGETMRLTKHKLELWELLPMRWVTKQEACAISGKDRETVREVLEHLVKTEVMYCEYRTIGKARTKFYRKRFHWLP